MMSMRALLGPAIGVVVLSVTCAAHAGDVELTVFPSELRALATQAEQGNAAAQFDLGQRYEDGDGLIVSDEHAVYWYRKAALNGNVDAQLRLAWLYIESDTIAEDQAESLKWLRMAADGGKAVAQYRLAWLYMNGDGVEKSVSEARRWFEKAAKQNFADAQNALGYTYAHNEPGEDPVLAAQWYLEAARQAHVFAIGNLADLVRERPKASLRADVEVRSQPSAAATRIGALHSGDVVYRLRDEGSWVAVVDARRRFVGWVENDQL